MEGHTCKKRGERGGKRKLATGLNGKPTSVHNAETFVIMRRFDEDEIFSMT